jgi:hypothetical protein
VRSFERTTTSSKWKKDTTGSVSVTGLWDTTNTSGSCPTTRSKSDTDGHVSKRRTRFIFGMLENIVLGTHTYSSRTTNTCTVAPWSSC